MIDLSAGQVVADEYRIDGVIGAGGMGVVIAATRLGLDQQVAIKLLRDASPEALARFQREARLIVRLKSAHVARVFDIGTLDDETPFIVMELARALAPFGSHRAQASAEQILATMGVEPSVASETLPSAPLAEDDDTTSGMVTAASATIPRMEATLVSPLSPPAPVPMSPSTPSPLMLGAGVTPARVRVGRSAKLLPAFGAVALLAAAGAWVSFHRSQEPHVNRAEPSAADVRPSVVAAVTPAASPTTSVIAASSPVPVLLAPPPIESTARERPPATIDVPSRPKPGPKVQTAPRHTATAHRSDPSLPPNPNDLPGGRR